MRGQKSGIHLAPDGYRIVYDELLKTLQENWPQYPAYKTPFKIDIGMEWEVENRKIAEAEIAKVALELQGSETEI